MGPHCLSANQLSVDAESMSEAHTHMELCGVEERRIVDDGCTCCVAVHESFASKNTCVTADVKQRIGPRFVLNISVKNAFISPDTESMRLRRSISIFKYRLLVDYSFKNSKIK